MLCSSQGSELQCSNMQLSLRLGVHFWCHWQQELAASHVASLILILSHCCTCCFSSVCVHVAQAWLWSA